MTNGNGQMSESAITNMALVIDYLVKTLAPPLPKHVQKDLALMMKAVENLQCVEQEN